MDQKSIIKFINELIASESDIQKRDDLVLIKEFVETSLKTKQVEDIISILLSVIKDIATLAEICNFFNEFFSHFK